MPIDIDPATGAPIVTSGVPVAEESTPPADFTVPETTEVPSTTPDVPEVPPSDAPASSEEVHPATEEPPPSSVDTPTESKPEDAPSVEGTDTPALSPKEARIRSILAQCDQIRQDYGGTEGDVPIGHEYWKLLNSVRTLRSEP